MVTLMKNENDDYIEACVLFSVTEFMHVFERIYKIRCRICCVINQSSVLLVIILLFQMDT